MSRSLPTVYDRDTTNRMTRTAVVFDAKEFRA